MNDPPDSTDGPPTNSQPTDRTPTDRQQQRAFPLRLIGEPQSVQEATHHEGSGDNVIREDPAHVKEESVDGAISLSVEDGTEESPRSIAGNRSECTNTRETDAIFGKRIALVGRFASMNRREATNVLLSFNAKVIDLGRAFSVSQNSDSESSIDVDWVVIGDEQPPLTPTDLLDQSLIEAAGRGDCEVFGESELWQRLGLVELEQSIRRYHTPAMLADLCGVSVRVIRRWQRLGLITPARTVHRLPYFDYAEVATAKRLANWIAEGASPRAIEQRLVELVEVLPNIRRPLDQLSILVEGKQLLLRQGDGLIEPGGQMVFNFDALEDAPTIFVGESGVRETVPIGTSTMFSGSCDAIEIGHDPLLAAAYDAEDQDDLETAVDLYHTILARDGARADICFQLAELLYRMDYLVAARERYYAAIELDPELVEARASLGAVLAEIGQDELAIAALRGALTTYDEYADVHYTLAKVLDRVGREVEAELHWRKCWELSPDSPWAEEAQERLSESR